MSDSLNGNSQQAPYANDASTRQYSTLSFPISVTEYASPTEMRTAGKTEEQKQKSSQSRTGETKQEWGRRNGVKTRKEEQKLRDERETIMWKRLIKPAWSQEATGQQR